MKCYEWFLLISLAPISFSAQSPRPADERASVQVPRNISLSAIAVQPNCPLAFEEVGHFAYVTGGFFNSYRLRNIGTKPIRAFKVATSSGAEMGIPRELGLIILPGELVPEPGTERDIIVPLTIDRRNHLKLAGPMKGLVILMVVNVEFTDGTSFHDEPTYQAMRTFMDKIGDALRERDEIRKNRP